MKDCHSDSFEPLTASLPQVKPKGVEESSVRGRFHLAIPYHLDRYLGELGIALAAGTSRRSPHSFAENRGEMVVPRIDPTDDAQGRDWLPFALNRQSFIEILATINGRASLAIIDSGATRTVVDSAWARENGIKTGSAFEASGLTRKATGEYIHGLEFEIGQFRLENVTAAAFDLASLTNAMGYKVDAVIGMELFESSIVEIDFPNGCLRILDDSKGPRANAIELRSTAKRLRTVPVRMLECPELAGIVDLGSSIPLYVDPHFAEASGLLNNIRTSTSATAGVEGVSISRIAILPTVDFAGFRLTDVPVQVPETWSFDASAVIGLPILNRFRLSLDFSRSRIWLQPDESRLPLPFERDRSGLGAARENGHLRVVHVAQGSPALRAALQIGDLIVAVNGKSIQEYVARGLKMGTQPAGTKVELTLSSGRFVSFELEDYF